MTEQVQLPSENIEIQQPRIDLEITLKGLIERHNALEIKSHDSIVQLEGQINEYQKLLTEQTEKNLNLENEVKSLIHAYNKIQVESSTLVDFLQKRGVNFQNYADILNTAFQREFRVNSENVPVGHCTVSHYNL